MVKEFNEKNFEDEVIKSKGLTVVDFFATWCGPCKAMAPIIDELSESRLENVKFGKVDVDENQELAEKYEVMSIPTIMIFKDGEILNKFVGFTDKEKLIEALS